jgi:hypothetical protein
MQFHSFMTSVVPNILVAMPSKKEKLSLSVTHPELAREADGWDPSTVTKGSDKKLSWVCYSGHSWEATVSNRTNRKSGCPFCAGQRVEIGVNDLASRFPDLALEVDGWDPQTEAYGTAHKRAWRCNNGHKWVATVLSRTQGNGCPYCSNNKVLPGFNDLQTINASLAAEALGWDPSKISPYSHQKLSWKCNLGHTYTATIANRSNGSGCPVCVGKTITPGFNDLATTDPEIAAQAFGWDPTLISRSTHKLREWICPLEHKWKAKVYSRQENGCPICSGKKVLKGFNDLQTTHPTLSREALGWDPQNYTRGSGKKMKWKCTEGHTWEATIASRAGLSRGCPSCSESGFNPNENAWLYFLEQNVWGMLQIGISNDINRRLKKHALNGWEVIEVRGPMEGYLTKQWETSILKMLKAVGADLSNFKIAGKFDGYSEAWSKSTFQVDSISELMKLTEEFEEK